MKESFCTVIFLIKRIFFSSEYVILQRDTDDFLFCIHVWSGFISINFLSLKNLRYLKSVSLLPGSDGKKIKDEREGWDSISLYLNF